VFSDLFADYQESNGSGFTQLAKDGVVFAPVRSGEKCVRPSTIPVRLWQHDFEMMIPYMPHDLAVAFADPRDGAAACRFAAAQSSESISPILFCGRLSGITVLDSDVR